MKKSIGLLIVLFVSELFCGCAMFSPASMLSEYFKKVKLSIVGQEDPELIRQGVPTLIILLDAAVAQDPDNSDLLRSASTMYATYAQAFMVSNGEIKRAAVQYKRAKDYAMRLLNKRSFYAKIADAPFDDFEKVLLKFDKGDVPDLYAAGNAWLGWILTNTSSMEALSELPRALAIMKRVMELDDSYADGGVHLVFGIYYAVQPPGAGRDLKKSKEHFLRAIELGGEKNLLPKVTYAEFYLTAAGDEKAFDQMLESVVNAGETDDPEYVLINAIAKERAKKLIENKDEYF
jgi:tetratricopeptide (TPR) repeat protein